MDFELGSGPFEITLKRFEKIPLSNMTEPERAHRTCANPTSCVVCKEAMRYFQMGPTTLSAIAGRMQKRVSTISYHVGGLILLGAIRKTGNRYQLSSAERVDELTLQVISEGPKTLDEVISDMRLAIFNAEQVHQSIDRHLLRRHIVSWPRPQSEAGSIHFVDEYKLSYVGSEVLHVCLHCGKPLSDEEMVVQFRVQEVIAERNGAINLGREELHHGAFFHASCFAEEQKADYLEQEKLRDDELCGLCGLPIDANVLEQEYASRSTTGVESLIPFFNQEELIGLVSYATKKKPNDWPSLVEAKAAAREILRKDKLVIKGLADCERLLYAIDEGLRRLRRRGHQPLDISNRAKELWRVAANEISSYRERSQSLIREICTPPSVLLGRTSLYLQIYPFMEKGEFAEEEVYQANGRKQIGMIKGSVEDASCGLAVKSGTKFYHPNCYVLLNQIRGPMTSSRSQTKQLTGQEQTKTGIK